MKNSTFRYIAIAILIIALACLMLGLVSCDDSPPTHSPNDLHEQIIGTIDGIKDGSHGGNRILLRGLDNREVWINTCNEWPVAAGKTYVIDTYRVWVHSQSSYGSCYHSSNVVLFNQ